MKIKRKLLLLAFAGIASLQVLAQDKEAVDFSNKVRVNFKAKDATPPQISIVEKNEGMLNAEGKVLVDIYLADKGGLGLITINGEQIDAGKKDSLVVTRTLSPAASLSVLARDVSNNAASQSFVIKGPAVVLPVAASLPVMKTERKYYALLIAVEEYEDPAIQQLSEPFKDAKSLKEVLQSKYTFEEQNIKLLKDPTFEAINVEFEELSKKIEPTDMLLIFYAGHGYFDTKTNIGYWLPSDAQEKNRAKWFRNSALVENIGAINSKHTLLIADACFSGGIFKTRAPFNNASVDIADMLKRPSRKAMTSGSLTTVPDKSVFMKYLLRTLNENENQYLPSEDLFDDIRIAMKNNSDTRPLYGEIQNVGDEGGNFVLIRKN